jgi:ABC-type dipeptide/oligopeptide/nickel transport system ATPase component
VLVTHDLAQAARLADDVLVLDAGRLVESGPAAHSSYLARA